MIKGLMKKLSAVALAVVMSVSFVPVIGSVTNGAVGQVEAKAAEIVSNGTIGDNASWTLDDESELDETSLQEQTPKESINILPQNDIDVVNVIKVDELEDVVLTVSSDDFAEKKELEEKCNSQYGYQDIIDNLNSNEMRKLYEDIDRIEKDFFRSTDNLTSDNPYLTISYENTLDNEEVIQVYTIYRYDHPLYYWMDNSISITGDTIGLMCDESYLTAASRDDAYNKIVNAISEYEDYCKGASSYYTYATACLYYMAQTIDYAYNEDFEPETAVWAHNIMGVFDENYHQAVCEGYAKAYQLLMNYFDIPNVFVVGKASGNVDNEGDELVLHAWNLVQMDDGNYYYTDPTWSDVDIRRDYFGNLITEEVPVLNRNYIKDYPYRVRYNYHLKGNAYFLNNHFPLTETNSGWMYQYKLPEVAAAAYQAPVDGEKQYERLDLRVSAENYIHTGDGIDTPDNISFLVVQNDGLHRSVELEYLYTGSKDLVVPSSITFEGVSYDVVGLDLALVDDWIESVTIEEGIRYVRGLINYESSITKWISFPSTLEFIDSSQLSWTCLENIYISSDNPYCKDEDGVLYSKDGKVLIRYPVESKRTSYSIPVTCERLYASSFMENRYLENLTIPESVTDIETCAFQNIHTLLSLNIPSSVKELPQSVITGCDSIKKVYISRETVFDPYIFTDCYGLEEIEIEEGNPSGYVYDGALYGKNLSVSFPDGSLQTGDVLLYYPPARIADQVLVKNGCILINEESFRYTKSVREVVIPDDCYVHSAAFVQSGVESLEISDNNTSILYQDGAIFSTDGKELYTYLAGRKDTYYKLPDSVDIISSFAFAGNPYIETIEMSDNVKDVLGRAFYECTALKNIKLSNAITFEGVEQEVYAEHSSIFEGCYSLQEIRLPEGMTTIPSAMFSECNSLNRIFIPESVKHILDLPLTDSAALTDIYYSGSEEEWNNIKLFVDTDFLYDASGIRIHYNYDGKSEKKYATDFAWTLTNNGELILSGNGQMRAYAIEESPWYDQRNTIRSVIIDDGLTSISKYALFDCQNLKKVDLVEGIETIDKAAFAGTAITELVLPSTLTEIGINAFSGCKALESVYVPKSLRMIDKNAFNVCDNLKDVYYEGSKEDWTAIKISGENNSQLLNATIHYNCTKNSLEQDVTEHIHKYGDWTVTKEPTCTEAGSREKVCTVCGNTVTEELPATGHQWNDDYTVDKPATHSEEGSESIHCAVCNEIKEGSSRAIPFSAHEFGDWTITKPATCTEEGEKVHECSDCGFKETVVLPATGHHWNSEYTVDKEPSCIEEGSESIHCSVCDEVRESSSRTIAKIDHTYGEWTVTKAATYTEVGIKEQKCTVCGHAEQAEIPMLEKKGWIREGGDWYYYNADGSMLKNAWKKDSRGWCWLQEDGRMLTNGWAKDSKGWCYIGAKGYMVEQTKWIKVDGNWYHIAKGYRDQSKWMKDSKGWCYLGKDGKMVTNGWAKDSKGWCWMGSDGYWVSNKWIQSGGQWYYIKSNHYMAANEWAKDSGGWMYMDGSGKITKNKWVKSGGYWYYLKSNGYMATGTLKISGKTYKFDSSGRWIS